MILKMNLRLIVKFGGIVEDVIIEHPLYGEIKGMLMIKTSYDVQNFMKKFNEYKAEPLIAINRWEFILHTIMLKKKRFKKNNKELKNKMYLIIRLICNIYKIN